MSAKKQSGSSACLWITCPKCGLQFHNRPLLQKHTDPNNGCVEIIPFLNPDTGISVFELAVIPHNADFGFGDMVRLRKGADFLFINSNFMREQKLQTLDWVLVEEYRKNAGDKSFDSSYGPIAMQLWMVPEATTCLPSPFKAFVSQNSFLSHPDLSPGTIVSVQLLQRPYQPIPARSIQFEISGNPADFNIERLKNGIKQRFRTKPVTQGLVLRIEHFAQLLTIKVRSFHHSFTHELSCVAIIDDSVVDLEWKNDFQDLDENDPPKVKLEQVGGLSFQAKEIIDTIQYIFDQKPGIRVPRGIILHGQFGTGKTLLVNAVCNSLNIHKVSIEDFPTKPHATRNPTFKESCDEAIRFSGTSHKGLNNGAAIIIENLESFGPLGGKDGYSSNFAQELRREMDRLTGRVVVLCTCNNVDLVDPYIRSPHVFGKEIEIPIPSPNQRYDIFRKLLIYLNGDLGLIDDDISEIANSAHGFVGADFQSLITEAVRIGGMRPTKAHIVESLKYVKPSAMKSIQLEIPDVRWNDIGGMDDLKFKLRQSIEWPLKHPEAFVRLGITPPKGILMYGPPGCSKTMIAKAIATESGLNFLSVKGSDLFSKWVGESEKAVQSLFRKARQVAPCILFFDELDAVGSSRGQQGSSNVHERVLAQLLVEIDGIVPLKDVTIVAATNRPDLIDTALTRPGRLDRLIYVPLPDTATRREIFKIKFRKMPIAEDVNIDRLVELTNDYSGAEITGICQEAGLKALEEDFESVAIKDKHFTTAIQMLTKRISPELTMFYEEYSNKVQC